MSQAPKCRFCETAHWGKCGFQKPTNEPVTTPGVVTQEKPKKMVTTVTARPKKAKLELKADTTKDTTQKERRRLKSAKWREANREKYNEYMRTLRAKKAFSHLENMDGI